MGRIRNLRKLVFLVSIHKEYYLLPVSVYVWECYVHFMLMNHYLHCFHDFVFNDYCVLTKGMKKENRRPKIENRRENFY